MKNNQSDHKQQHMDKNLETQKTAIDPKYGDQPWQAPTYGDRDKSQGQLVSPKDKSRGLESSPGEVKEESSWGSKDKPLASAAQKQKSEVGNKTHGNQSTKA